MPELPRCRNKSLKLAQRSGHLIISLTEGLPDRETNVETETQSQSQSQSQNQNQNVVLVKTVTTTTTTTTTIAASQIHYCDCDQPYVDVETRNKPKESSRKKSRNRSSKESDKAIVKGKGDKVNHLNRMNRLYKILSVVFKAINYGRGENGDGVGDDSSGRRSELGRSRSVSESRRSRPPSAPSQRKPPVIRIRRERSLNGVMWGSPQQLTTTSDSANTTVELSPNALDDEPTAPSRRSRKRQKQRYLTKTNSTSDSYLNNIQNNNNNIIQPPIISSQYNQYYKPSSGLDTGVLQQSVSHMDLHSGNHLRVDEGSRHSNSRGRSKSQDQSQRNSGSSERHLDLDPYQQHLYSPEAERFVRAAIDKSQPALPSAIILTPQPVERQIIRIINGNDPTVQSQVLLNTKTSQPWEDLVRDLGMAVKLPKKRGSYMETISGRRIQSYSQLRSELQVGNQAFYVFPHREDLAELGLPSLSLSQHNANARSRRNGKQENPNLISLQNSIQNAVVLPVLAADVNHNNKGSNNSVKNQSPSKSKSGKTKSKSKSKSSSSSVLSSNSNPHQHPVSQMVASTGGVGVGIGIGAGMGSAIQRSQSHTIPLNQIGLIEHQQPMYNSNSNSNSISSSIVKSKAALPVRKSATTIILDQASINNDDYNDDYTDNDIANGNIHGIGIGLGSGNDTYNKTYQNNQTQTIIKGTTNNSLSTSITNNNNIHLPLSSRSNPNLSAPKSPSNLSRKSANQSTLQVPQNRKRSTRRRRSEASVYLASARSRSRSISP